MSPLLTGFAFGGSAGTPKATVTGSTGSPTVDTTSRVGKTIYKFTGSGTITVGVAGTCEYMVLGGGAVNGAGGYVYTTSGFLPAGTLTVTIGAGVAVASSGIMTGNSSALGNIFAMSGSRTEFSNSGTKYLIQGASSGGTTTTSVTNSALGGGQGSAGGSGITNTMGAPGIGGGGGAGGVGGNAVSTSSHGAGGAGATNSITGTSTTYCAGGAGSASGDGGANSGSGGGVGNTGGSGFVVVVIG